MNFQHLITEYGYLAVFVLMLAESACIPIPSEVIMMFGGALAAGAVSGAHPALAGIVAAGVAGNVAGSYIAWAVGRYAGQAAIRRWGRRIGVREHEIDRATAWFERHGPVAVLLGRIVPVIRTFISLPAGFADMPAGEFGLFTALGCIPWTAALAIAGYALGANWQHVANDFHGPTYAIVGVILVGVLAAIIIRRRQPRPSVNPSAPPRPAPGYAPSASGFASPAPGFASPAPGYAPSASGFALGPASNDFPVSPAHPGPAYPDPSYPGSAYPGPGYPEPASAGSAYPGPASPRWEPPGPAYSGPAAPLPANSGSFYPGPAAPSPANSGSFYPGPASPGPAYPGSAYPGAAYPGSAHPASAYPGPAYPGPTRDGYPGPAADPAGGERPGSDSPTSGGRPDGPPTASSPWDPDSRRYR